MTIWKVEAMYMRLAFDCPKVQSLKETQFILELIHIQ